MGWTLPDVEDGSRPKLCAPPVSAPSPPGPREGLQAFERHCRRGALLDVVEHPAGRTAVAGRRASSQPHALSQVAEHGCRLHVCRRPQSIVASRRTSMQAARLSRAAEHCRSRMHSRRSQNIASRQVVKLSWMSCACSWLLVGPRVLLERAVLVVATCLVLAPLLLVGPIFLRQVLMSRRPVRDGLITTLILNSRSLSS